MCKRIKRLTLFVFLLSISNLGYADKYADKLELSFLEVRSGGKEWNIYREDKISASLSRTNFSTSFFCATHFRKSNYIHCYTVKGTITPTSSIYGDDVVATFTPKETHASPFTCKGKYQRDIPGYRRKLNVIGEMKLNCNDSSFKSFIVFSKKVLISLPEDKSGLYYTDRDRFWKKWNASRELLTSCKSPKNVSRFIIYAFAYTVNSAVKAANTREIVTLIWENPACLVEGLALLNDKQLKQFYDLFIEGSLVTNAFGQSLVNELVKSINKSGNIEKYPNVKKLFE